MAHTPWPNLIFTYLFVDQLFHSSNYKMTESTPLNMDKNEICSLIRLILSVMKKTNIVDNRAVKY